MPNYLQKAKNILETIQYATIATITPDGKPWNTPVAHEVDNDCVLYWFSDKENQHSQNVRQSPQAFIVIYDSTAPDGEGEGVYIEASVEELNNVEKINVIRNRKNKIIVNDATEFVGDSVRRCYKATPKRIWINDAEEKDGTFIRDYRVEIDLHELRSLCAS